MGDLTAIQIPKTQDEKVFERQIRDLFAVLLENPDTQMHGRRGQPQAGVDVYGIRSPQKPQNEQQWVGDTMQTNQ